MPVMSLLAVLLSAAIYPQVTNYSDQASLVKHLQSLGHHKRGGIPATETRRTDPLVRAFPHFDSSFTANKTNYPFTMVGYAPSTGKTATINTMIFVTQNVTAEALGYHSAAETHYADGSVGLSTYLWSSWFDISAVDPLLADISTLNHEMAEWANDPYVNNVVPTWQYPDYPASQDPSSLCSGNPYLEVGDPQGNGPTYPDFPTAEVPLNGTTYHLQQLVMLPWFADQTPSSAYGGWYTFPLPQYISKPAKYCR